jgi:hypothetical protein
VNLSIGQVWVNKRHDGHIYKIVSVGKLESKYEYYVSGELHVSELVNNDGLFNWLKSYAYLKGVAYKNKHKRKQCCSSI